MLELENNICDLWNEMSYRRYNKKHSHKMTDDVYERIKFEEELEKIEICEYNSNRIQKEIPCGLYEDISIKNCYGVEDW